MEMKTRIHFVQTSDAKLTESFHLRKIQIPTTPAMIMAAITTPIVTAILLPLPMVSCCAVVVLFPPVVGKISSLDSSTVDFVVVGLRRKVVVVSELSLLLFDTGGVGPGVGSEESPLSVVVEAAVVAGSGEGSGVGSSFEESSVVDVGSSGEGDGAGGGEGSGSTIGSSGEGSVGSGTVGEGEGKGSSVSLSSPSSG